MKYYLVISDKIVKESVDLFQNKYSLVDIQFDNAYAETGFKIFESFLEKDKTEEIEIYDENKNKLTIEEFLNELQNYNLIYE